MFNLKFWLYLWRLGAGFSPQFSSRETLHTIYFPNCHITLRSYFFARKLMKIVIEKSCVIMENWNQTLCWKSFLGKFSVKSKTETKLCVTNQVCVIFETENQTLWINVALNFSVRENIILCATSVCFKWQVLWYFWHDAVKFKLLFIFVTAWCWICHLKTSRGTLNAIYFPNLRRTLHSYFSVW